MTVLADLDLHALFPDGFKSGRGWLTVLRAAGVEGPVSRQDLWDAMHPSRMHCRCGAICPPKQTNVGRRNTCGARECALAQRMEKTRSTCLERYGVESASSTDQFKLKQATTFKERYGDHPSRVPHLQQKRATTNMERYGTLTPAVESSRLESTKEKRERTKRERYVGTVWRERVKGFKTDLGIEALSEFSGIHEPIRWRHECGAEWTGTVGARPICPSCRGSTQERQLAQLLEQHVAVRRHDRSVISPYELDIYVPEKRLAVEFNGSYWHRDGASTPTKLKHDMAKQAGVRLITIADWEWAEKREVVQSHLLHAIGVTSTRIAARSCVVREINVSTSRAFLDRTHLQGACRAKHHLGLWKGEALVAVMTLGMPRWGDRTGLEVLRWSTELNVVVQGGFTKVLQHVLGTLRPERLISFCDLRYGTGRVYERAGFTLSHVTSPGYVWVKNGVKLARQQAQKHRLPLLLGTRFDADLSERENMERAGWCRVSDAGHQCWILPNGQP